MITFEDIKNDEEIKILIEDTERQLMELGYTEHGYRHLGIVSSTSERILKELGYPARTCELAKVAGYMHDIGNLVNRVDHSQSGAVMAFRILDNLGFDADEIAMIVSAIGNHDEGNGMPVSPLAAALILADKADVRRNRVRNIDVNKFDIHDRVNYSVKKTELKINEAKTIIKLKLSIDTHYGSVMDYFEIFMERMILCRKAADTLGLQFKLIINEQQLI